MGFLNAPVVSAKTAPVVKNNPQEKKQSPTPQQAHNTTPTNLVPYKIGGGDEQQEKVRYAWEISQDPNFIYLLEAENGLWTADRRSIVIGANGYYDYGLCQVNKGYHKSTVNDSRFFTDWKWQLEQCLRLYKGGTKFYGAAPHKREAAKKNFLWK